MDDRWRTIDSWMKAHGDSILRTVYLVTRDRAASEEIVQEVFLRAWRKLHQFEGRSSPSTWLHRIAVNLARNHLRRRRVTLLDTAPDAADPGYADAFSPTHDGPETLASRNDRRGAVRACVESLPQRLRMVVALYYLEERPVVEVARILGLPAGTVKSRLSKARSMLRDRLVAAGVEVEENDG